MPGKDQIQLRHIESSARLLSPLESYEEVTSEVEYRIDPLTGRRAIIGRNLAGKRAVLYPETDVELLDRLASKSREGCLFCPERVTKVTPRYPADLLGEEGRLSAGESLLFPNLFPLTEHHAVVALGSKHFRRLDEFTPELLAEGLGLAHKFIRAVIEKGDAPAHWAVCCNYLPPGGASIVHPHLQILGSSIALSTPRLEQSCARDYYDEHRHCFFEDIVSHEREVGERFIADHGPVAWMAAFAPRGNTELFGVCTDVTHLHQLDEQHIDGIAQGLSQGLRAYHSLGYSTFNFSIHGAPVGDSGDSFRVNCSLVSRQSLVENYRCDDYFLQKMLGTEILVDAPEAVADIARAASRV